MRGHDIFARLFKKEGVRRLLAAALLAAPLTAGAADLYPGYGAARSPESGDLYLPAAEILAQCGVIKTVKQGGGAEFGSISAAMTSVPTVLSTNTCVLVLDAATYNEQVSVSGINTNGYRLRILKDPALAGVSPTVSPSAPVDAFYINSDSVTVQGIDVAQSQAAHAFNIYGHYAELFQSTITLSQAGNYGIYMNGASTAAISGVYVSNTSGDALHFDSGAKNNTVSQSSLNASVTGKAAVYFANATSNTVTGSFVYNMMGYGARFDMNSFYNTISFSTVTTFSGTSYPVSFGMGYGNAVEDSYLYTNSGTGAYFGATARLSRSTVTAAGGGDAVRFVSSGSTVTYSSISSPNGTALSFAGSGNVVSFSTAASEMAGGYAVRIDGGSSGNNVLTGDYLYNSAGAAVLFSNYASGNVIAYSTLSAPGYIALSLSQAQNTSVADSYLQGGTAAKLDDGCDGSAIAGSVLVSTEAGKPGVALGGGPGISLSSSAITGGPGGAAVSIAATYGSFTLSSNTIRGGSIGVQFPSTVLTLSLSSMTFQHLDPGATAMYFLGGVWTNTFDKMAFDSPNIAVNVDASLLSGNITMTNAAGRRRGAVYEWDPGDYVSWTPGPLLPPGCTLGFNVAKDGGADADTIQAAVRALPAVIAADACVVIRDTATYSEQVTVRNIDNFGVYRIKIMADPTFVSSAPAVNPPAGSVAAFYIDNGSVTIAGIDVVSTNTVAYGIWTSSAGVSVSSVNIFSNGMIGTSGVRLAGRGSLTYSTVSVQSAEGVTITGAYNYVAFSSVSSYGYGMFFASNSDSNTVTQSGVFSRGDAAAYLYTGADWNEISYSTVASYSAQPALYLSGSGSNTITGAYVYASEGDAARLESGANNNSVSLSTLAAGGGSYVALYLGASSSNTVTRSYLSAPDGIGLYLDNGADRNSVSQTTIAVNYAGLAALYVSASSSNTVAGSYVYNPAGDAAYLTNGAAFNTISGSSVTSGAFGYSALRLSINASSNTVADSYISNPEYRGVMMDVNANSNVIRQSTVTSNAAGNSAIYLFGVSSGVILDSYVQGSTAVYVSGSTGTVIGGSVLVSTWPYGAGLSVGGGSRGLSLATSTVSGGGQGPAVFLGTYNSGEFLFSSNTVNGGAYGLNIATQSAGASLNVSSITFRNLTAGATAINFINGYFTSTITAAAFDSANITVNVNGAALAVGSLITMRADAGSRTGAGYENDPLRRVVWPEHPCDARTSWQSGNWSAADTWDTYLPPTACSPVVIAAGHTVTIDALNAVSSGTVINGTARASRVGNSSWTLTGGDLVVNARGTLDYGSEADPVPSGKTAHLVLSSGSYAGRYGLVVNDGGNFTVRGADKTPYAYATASIPVGPLSFGVYGSTSVAGWQPGDTIVFGPTSGNGAATAESRVISGISGGPAYTVSWFGGGLAQPRNLSAGTPVIVANLTRNVLVRSSGTVTAAANGNSAYIRGLAQNATSFSLVNGEFAYLGSGLASRSGITFDGPAARGEISSSTVRDGYYGVLLDGSSGNTLAANHFCYNSGFGAELVNGAGRNLLAGNNFFANAGYGVYLYSLADRNTLERNNVFSNANAGIYIEGNTGSVVAGNNSFSNAFFGLDLYSAGGALLAGNNLYSNGIHGAGLWNSSDNVFAGNSLYSNAANAMYLSNSAGNVFADGRLGYDGSGASAPDSSAELSFDPGKNNSLIMKGSRVNPAPGLSVAGLDTPYSYLLSYDQDFAAGTVKLWGNYRVAGSTLALDHAEQLYASTATAVRLMRGSGHSAAVTAAYDAAAVSQLITIAYRDGMWRVSGSSTGAMAAFVGSQSGIDLPLANPQFKLDFTPGTPAEGDRLSFLLLSASKDASVQKRLLFGPSAPAFNYGRSKLEVDPSGGVLLRGKPGVANALVDRLDAASTYYTFVDSGAFTAEYSSFTNMDQGGLQLSGSAEVRISSVTFDYLGFASGTNAYITARDLVSNAVISSAAFALSRAQGLYSAYNVWVEGSDAGLDWSFTEPAGPLWGERYDMDPGNKVAWINCGPMVSVQTGKWSVADTWDAGNTPSACNTVTVNPGHVITIDVMNAVSSTATIYGAVAASDQTSSSWTLVGGDILVKAGGTLDYGGAGTGIPQVYSAHLVLASGTYAGEHGLVVDNGGNFTVRGAPKTPYSYAAADIGAGDTWLYVYGSTSVAGWQARDLIAIGPTTIIGAGGVSTRTIAGITAGPLYRIDWLEGPLPQARLLSDGPVAVANLTRNVLVRSSGTVSAAAGGNTAYVRSLARNATSFELLNGEFAYLGSEGTGRDGVRLDGAGARGLVSSSTFRNGYSGLIFSGVAGSTAASNNLYANSYLGVWLTDGSTDNLVSDNNIMAQASIGLAVSNSSDRNALTGNGVYSCGSSGIQLDSGSGGNLVRGNSAYCNSYNGIYLNGAQSNLLAGNRAYRNNNVGMSLAAGSGFNTLSGNGVYLNGTGVYVNSSGDNLLFGNSVHSNSISGVNMLASSIMNTLAGNAIYGNGSYGVYLDDVYSALLTGDVLGYAPSGAAAPNGAADIYLDNSPALESVVMKGVRLNPASGVDASGLNRGGNYVLSFNQDADTGTVRLWGNYQEAWATITMDHGTQLYVSTATRPKLMRGSGHFLDGLTTSDANALTELVTVTYAGSSLWRVEGSSSGVLNAAFPCGASTLCGFSSGKFSFGLNTGPAPVPGDYLDFVTVAASGDAGVQKKLLFGPSAASYNNGRSKLEIAPTAGIILRGKPDGTAHTLVDRLNAASTYYTFVDSGSFTAEHSSFTNMDQGGIQLYGTGGVTLSSSTFDYLGFANGTNAYITARSLDSASVLHNVTFGLSRSSAAFSAYNIWVEGGDSGLNLLLRKAKDSLGPLWGEAYERDPNGKVAWADDMPVIPGCDYGVTVRQDGSGYYTSIQQAVDMVNHVLTGNVCVVIRDAGTYGEKVEIRNFTGNGYRLKIMADPSLGAPGPVVNPPAGAQAAFLIQAASVSVQGISIIPANSLPYGIQASSANAVISSVNVVSGGNITSAAMTLSGWSLVENSSITAQAAYGLRLENGGFNTVRNSTVTSDSSGYYAFYAYNSSFNVISEVFVANPQGDAMRLYDNAHDNEISRSTVVTGAGSNYALWFYEASSNTVSGSVISNSAGSAAYFGSHSSTNTVRQSVVAGGGGTYHAFWIAGGSSSNTITDSFVTNGDGNAVYLSGADGTHILGSTITCASPLGKALYISASSSATVSGSYLANPAGYGAVLDSGAAYNTVVLSTIASAAAGKYAVNLQAAEYNRFDRAFLSNPAGYGVSFYSGSRYNSIEGSTLTSNGPGLQALYLSGASSNTIKDCRISHDSGYGVFIGAGSDNNSILQSTVTSNYAGYPALYVYASSSNTVLDSYVQGSTAAHVSASTGTVIGGSSLVSFWADGAGLVVSTGSVNLSLSTSSVKAAGAAGSGIYLAPYNSGVISLSSNVVDGGRYGLNVAPQYGALSIASMTFNSLSAGATAINFLGGQFVSTFSSVGFNAAGIAVNVNGAALLPGSRVTMRHDYGPKGGPLFEKDPAGYIEWDMPALCNTGVSVAQNGSANFSSIQAAVSAVPAALSTNTCVVVRDTQTYSEQITVRNFANAGYRLMIIADPTFASSAPVVNPPAFSTAAFLVMNDSVTITGLSVVSTNTVPYGVLSSSANLFLSGVSVVSGGKINYAGVSLSSFSRVEDSSVTVQDAYGLVLNGRSSEIVASTVASASGGLYALYLSGSSSNTVSGSFVYNPDGYGVSLGAGCDYNAIRQSTVTSGGAGMFAFYSHNASSITIEDSFISNPAGYGVWLDAGTKLASISRSAVTSGDASANAMYLFGASSVTVDGSYIYNSAGDGLHLESGANHNAIARSTIAAEGPSKYALYLSGASSNTVSGSLIASGAGTAVYVYNSSKFNSIRQSTMTSEGIGSYALFLAGSSSNTVADSYLRGDTAVMVSNSADTAIGGSTIERPSAGGNGLVLTGVSTGLSLSTSVVAGGLQGTGVYLAAGNYGAIRLSTVTVSGGKVGLYVGAQGAGATLLVDSVTFQGLTPGATAVNFAAAVVISTFNGAVFDSPGLETSINASDLANGSSIYVLLPSGAEAAQALAKDPAGYVQWPWPASFSVTAVHGNNVDAAFPLNGAAGYALLASTSADFSAPVSSGTTDFGVSSLSAGLLLYNTTYYVKAGALWDRSTYYSQVYVGTVTDIESPADIYFEYVGTTTLVISAYAPGPALTGMERGVSAVNFALSGAYGVWGSSGNYWNHKQAMNYMRRDLAAGAIGGKLYAIGGFDGLSRLKVTEEYDPVTDVWTIKRPMLTARQGLAVGVIGGRLYAVGGTPDGGGTYLAVNEEYDPVADTWTARAPLPTPRTDLAAAVIGGKLYAVGGVGDGGWLRVNEEYDAEADAWIKKSSMTAARNGFALGAIGGRLYAAGGFNGVSDLVANEEYDPDSDGWAAKAPLPSSASLMGGAVINGKLHLVGGSGSPKANLAYDPQANVWTARAEMPTGRFALAAAALNGTLYAVGGSITGANEQYVTGAERAYTFMPNSLRSFKAKARGQNGVESGESATVSTYTFAAAALYEGGETFQQVYRSSVALSWSPGTALTGYNGAGARYLVQASTAQNFAGNRISSFTAQTADSLPGLMSNTTYHFRVQAYNSGGMTDYGWLQLGTTVTHAIMPNAAAAPFGNVSEEGTEIYWGANNNSPGTSYRVQVSSNSNFDPLHGNSLVAVTSSAVGGLIPNTTWYARAAAVSYSGVMTEYYVIGDTLTRSAAPSDILFPGISSRTITAEAYSPYGFPNLPDGFSGIRLAKGGAYDPWQKSTGTVYAGLAPNTSYVFKAMSRDQSGRESAESPDVSTYTLAAASLPQTGPVFGGVSDTGITVNWSSGTLADGFNGAGALYEMEISLFDTYTPANNQVTSDLFAARPGLSPNTTYYFRVAARNSAGVLNPDWQVLGATSTLTVQATDAAVAAVFPTSVTVSWAAMTLSASEGFVVAASSVAGFSGVVHSSATDSSAATSLTVEGLFANTTYYLRVGPLNWNGVANYSGAGSTCTPKENIAPVITDNELLTDYTWYGSAARTYDVTFHDDGGSALENVQVKAATAPAQGGLITADWTDVIAGIDANDYAVPWGMTPEVWDLLQDGTNYISVRAFDGSGNSAEKPDAFVVFKDTTPPSISDGVNDAFWQNAPGAANPVTVSDPHSRVDSVQYAVWSAPDQGGEQLVAWIDLGLDLRQADFTDNFVIGVSTWALLQSGTNYVSLRARDYSVPVNTNLAKDAFVVLKDTVAPEAINSLTAVSGSTYSAQISFFGPYEYPSGIAEFAVQYASYTVAWATSSVAGSSHVYISTSGVNYLSQQSVEIAGLLPNATYYFRAWARDQAGNWSGAPNYDAVSTLAEPPVYLGVPQVYTSSASVAWLPVDAAGFRVEAGLGAGFSPVVLSSATSVPAVTSLYLEGMAPNTTYYIRPVSLNWPGVPNYGNIYVESTFAVQPSSAGVYAAVSSDSITVEWLSAGNGPGTRYILDISSNEFTDYGTVAVVPVGADPYSLEFPGLYPNTTYWFRLQSQGNHGEVSAWLPLGSTVTAPVPPVLTGYAFWTSSASVDWSSNGNGAGTVYQCDLSTSAGFTGVLVSSSEAGKFAFDMGPIASNTTYYLRLRAKSAVSGMTSPYVYASGLTYAFAPESVGAWTVGPNNVGVFWDSERNPGAAGYSAWSATASLPAALYGHSGAIAGGTAFVAGGYDGSSYKRDVWYAPLSADGAFGTWKRTRDLPAARYAHASAALRGRLYVLGGYDGSAPRAEVWSAPISSSGALGEWAAETPLPLAVYAFGLGVGENTLYVAGGYNGGPVRNVWYARVNSDGTLSGWNPGPDLDQAAYALAAAVGGGAAGPALYATGGYDGVSGKSGVWKAAIAPGGSLNAWTTETSLSAPVYAHAMAYVPGALIISGGNGGTLARTDTLLGRLNADGSVAGWSAGTPLNAARQSHLMFARGSRLVALGGYDGAQARTEGYYSTLSGTEHRLYITGAPFAQTPWMVSGDQDVGALVPNSYYIFRPAARNYAGIEALGAVTFSTFTYAAQPSSAPISRVFISSMQANWLPNDNPAGTRYEAQLSSDAAHTQLAFSSATANAFAVFTGLKDDYAYYARVRAVNDVGVATAWTALGSGVTRADPALDFTAPAITDNQGGDDNWRRAGGALYDVDIADAGGSYLQRFSVRASTTQGTGPYAPDWTDVAAGMDTPSYSADWALPAGFFDLLPPGTSYISVMAQDGNANTAFKNDAFYVLKDTAVPVITDLQGGENSWRMDAAGPVYDVDFADDVSGLAGIEYSASPNQGSGDAAALGWTPVAAVPAGLKSFAQGWGPDFAALANDATNYISVRAWDLAGNTVTVSGIDVFKILKYVSGPEVWMTAPNAPYLAALPAAAGTASDARSHTAAAVEVSVKDEGAGKYWDGTGFLASSPKWIAAAGTAVWTYAPGITWEEGAAYQVVARASDTAGNYSLVYATRSFTFDSLPPVIGPAVPADGAVVNGAAAISGTASDVSGLSSLRVMLKRVPDGKWWDFSAGTWTVSGSSAAVSPAAAWSYAPSDLLRASLETGVSYYYTLAAADNTAPVKSADFGVYGSTFGFLDDTAPAAIAGLNASTGNAPGNISLSWNAPGDDGGTGMILYGQYRIQYSTMPAAAFSTAAAQVSEDFTAVSAGSARSRELTGLTAGETYYLRAWTRDDAYNWSPLSNAATAQAAPYPDRISGHVMKVSSEGITGVLVEAFDPSGALKGSAYTVNDGSGSYVITGLAADSYRLQATWEADDIISSVGSEGFSLGASNADFTLAINYELASIGGELSAYRLAALRYRAKGGRPLAAAQVELYQRGRLIAAAPVDAAGRFLIKSLLPGKYVLRVPDGNGGMKELAVRVKAGEALQISPLGELLKAGKVYVYPNPAGRLATFHIESDQAPITKQAAVFDVTGRLVAELNDSSFVIRNGGWEADWNIPSKVASGVYVYRIRVKFEATGETKKTVKKFAIVK